MNENLKIERLILLAASIIAIPLGFIAYALMNTPHYQISGAGEVVWKVDTQTGSLERCYPKVETVSSTVSYIEVVCDPDD